MHRLRSAATAAATVLLASIALTACGGGSDDEATGGDTKSLEVWSRGGPEALPTYRAIFDQFTKDTGIKVDYKPIAEFDPQLQARISQKKLPDLFINDAGSLGQYQSQGILKPIDRDKADPDGSVADETWEESQGIDGKLYGVPFSRQANILVVRKDWREKVGAQQPKTWDELTALATKFATDDPDGNGKDDTYGMVVPGTSEDGYIARWGVPYIWQAGGQILEPGKKGTYTSAIDSPETKQAMEYVRTQFCTKGNVVPGAVNNNTQKSPFFVDGTAGIYLTGPYQLSLFDENVGKENVEVVPMPKGPQSATTFSEGENIYFGASSRKDDAQYKLASYMITAQAQKAGMDSPADGGTKPYTSMVRLPVNTSLDAGKIYQDPRWQITAQAYEDDSQHFPWDINFIPFRNALAEGMNAIVSDCGSDIDAELAKVDEAFKAELKNQDLAG